MRDSTELTPIQACVDDWWRGQSRLAGVGHPARRVLSRLTNGFFEGPWAKVAFDEGWTAEDLFGIRSDPVAGPDEFSEDLVAGLIPMMALSPLRPVILNIAKDRVTVMCGPDRAIDGESEPGQSVGVIDRNRFGGRRVVWWRHTMWMPSAAAKISLGGRLR